MTGTGSGHAKRPVDTDNEAMSVLDEAAREAFREAVENDPDLGEHPLDPGTTATVEVDVAVTVEASDE